MHAYHVANVLELQTDLGIVIKKYYIRYGAMLARPENVQFRLTKYTNGDVESLPELDSERLLFNPNVKGLNYSELSYRALKISDGE